MLRDADRAHARTAAAVRDAERLVQVEVAHVRADVARPARARPARSCSRRPCTPGRRAACTIAQISRDRLLEHAVRRRVRHHQRGELRRVRRGLRARGRRRRCCPRSSHSTTTTFMPAITALAGFVPCAECGIRQTLRPRGAAVLVVRADHEQAGVLALRAGVRLQRARGEAGDLREPAPRGRGRAAGSPSSARAARTDGCARSPAT